jgi:hypothetical protein
MAFHPRSSICRVVLMSSSEPPIKFESSECDSSALEADAHKPRVKQILLVANANRTNRIMFENNNNNAGRVEVW